MTTTTSEVVVIYSGLQNIVGADRSLNLFMCNHIYSNCIEIFANDPVPGEESDRIYVNAEMVMSKLENGVLLEEFDRRMKELLRLNQINDRSALLRDVTSRLVVKFLLDRLKIYDNTSAKVSNSRSPSLVLEPKPHDKLSPTGSLDFQFNSKPEAVSPAKLVLPSGKTLPSDAEISIESVKEEKEDASITELDETDCCDGLTECELDDSVMDNELNEIKARNQYDCHVQHISECQVPSVDTQHDDWMLGESNVIAVPEESEALSYHALLITTSGKGHNDSESAPMYNSDSDSEDGEEVRKSVLNKDGEYRSRKTLTRKRSMSESDLYLKAAGLASLSVKDPLSDGIAGSVRSADDEFLFNLKPSTDSNKQLLPHMTGDFKYNRDVPIDGNIPSYLLPTSSNYAKKLPPIRPTTATAGSRPGTASSSRPSTADTSSGGSVRRSSTHSCRIVGNSGVSGELSLRKGSTAGQNDTSLRRSSNSSNSNNVNSVHSVIGGHHGGAVGRIQDLKSQKVSPSSVSELSHR